MKYLKEMEKEKCCGNCCWFYGETTDGDGFCAALKGAWSDDVHCYMSCHALHEGKEGEYAFVCKKEMRHHMAVMLQRVRVFRDGYIKDNVEHYAPSWDELYKAYKFAYRYMKVFSKL